MANKRHGIWDIKNNRFVFNIDEDSKNRAIRELQRRTGRELDRRRYDVRSISSNWHNPENPKYSSYKSKRKTI